VNFNIRRKKNGVPILSKIEIEQCAEALIQGFKPSLLKEPAPVPIDEFVELYLDLQMDYQDLTPDNSILGMVAFNDGYLKVYDFEKQRAKCIEVREGTVLIDNCLTPDDQRRRCRFTYGHESGHWIFHRERYKAMRGQLTLFEVEEMETVKCLNRNVESIARKNLLHTDEDWMEWQADYLSSALLMPRKSFHIAVQELFEVAGVTTGYIVKNQDADLDMYAQGMAPILADLFDVSVQAASIRLEKLGYVRSSSKQMALG
jgi:Zn-dependent peptidase ImmA (M78 family)